MSEPHIPGDHLQKMAPDPQRYAEIDQRSPGERAEPLTPSMWRNRMLGLLTGLVGAGLVYLLMPADWPARRRSRPPPPCSWSCGG